MNHEHAWVFDRPVDPVALGIPDYFDVIDEPMDLTTIKNNLENGLYKSAERAVRDLDLVFDNAMLYNEEGTVIHEMAKEMKQWWIVQCLIKYVTKRECSVHLS